MNAEIGIDEEGKAYIAMYPASATEWQMMQYMKAFLPIRLSAADRVAHIVGDRLPGSGKGG